MSTAFSAAPLTDDVAGALAQFFYGGAGPSHTDITRVLTQSGYFDNYVRPSTGQGPNKQDRVLRAFREAHAAPARARQLVDGMLGLLRLKNLIGDPDDDQKSDDERQLRRALGAAGWHLDDTGHLHPFAGVDVDSGGREALDEMLARIRRSTADPGLLIGQAKDLLEAVAKFVLEELGMPVHKNMPYPALWHIARERLGVLPEQVDQDVSGWEAIREIHQSTWSIASQVNTLRNLQGVGHGRTLPTGVTEELAMLVVREACSVADYMLAMLNRSRGA